MGVADIETNCNALGNIFQGLINDMRDSVPVFEEFVSRGTKLHSSLRSTMVAIAAFLEAFQKVADVATGSKGATKEIGKSLTRLCLRHRSIESKLKTFAASLMEDLIVPLQEKLEDWKKTSVQIDKDHARDYKRARLEIKRASSDTVRLQKKARKGKTTYSKGDAKEKLESAMVSVTDKFSVLEDCEKSYVRKALLEERKHFCDLICCLRPVVDSEMSMVQEMTHLQEIVDHLSKQAADPDTLPEASEQVIHDAKGSSFAFRPKTPPDSPTSDRHSLSSSMNSLVSTHESDAMSQRSVSPTSRLQPPKMSASGLLSVASQDSGFMSQDALFARPSAATANHVTNQSRNPNSVEEEKSDSMSVYSSVSQGSRSSSHDFDTSSLHSGSVHSVNIPSNLQSQIRAQLEKAHTISGTRPLSRPTVSQETYEPLTAPLPTRSSVSDFSGTMGPPRPIRTVSTESTISRKSSLSGNRISLPPKTRTKPKPVALPSVPFMENEPIYMNTRELAKRISERKIIEANQIMDEIAIKAPTTELEEREANSDALADALKELEASTAALNCLNDDAISRQSLVISSGYGTTTSNSSASEEVQIITQVDVPDHHTAAICNHITEETTNFSSIPDLSTTDLIRQSQGVEVTNWAGTAVLRRHDNKTVKPPLAEKTSNNVAAEIDRASQRGPKPPLLSPKPKFSSILSQTSSGSSRIASTNSNCSDAFPAPPDSNDADFEDPYAVPINCQPIDMLPPPPPGFDLSSSFSDADVSHIPFNMADLPPPLPETLPPATSSARISEQGANHQTTNLMPYNDQHTHSMPKPKVNSKGSAPPPTLKKGKLNTNFLHQLDSKLNAQTQAPLQVSLPKSQSNVSTNSHVFSKNGPSQSRDSLLTQIQEGIKLKRTDKVSDRSAPLIR